MKYYADELYIEKFRKINNQNIKFGDKITVFSGQNGVGKSNLLSLVAATFGVSKKRLLGGKFQPEFDDFFTISEKEDFSEYKTYMKVKTEIEGQIIQKRLGFKDDTSDGRGIRMIPRPTNHYTKDILQTTISKETKQIFNIGPSARIPVPTIYLSLARLYPVGETNIEVDEINTRSKIYNLDTIEKYKEWYNKVLPNSIINKQQNLNIVKKKVTDSDRLHVTLDNTFVETQSVGQDNLGSIISALIDFYVLSENEGYNGGILCIDELDASLHPNAQINLFNLLKTLSEELNLQVFITTHSLTILKIISKLKEKDQSNYQLVYIVDPYQPRVSQINNYRELKADLFDKMTHYRPKIKLYCEDEMTKFIYEQLIETSKRLELLKSNLEIDIISVSLGCEQLKQLPNLDEHFKEVLIVLDGDAKTKTNNLLYRTLNNDLKGINNEELAHNIVCLPSYLAPESYMYFITHKIFNESKHDKFWYSLDTIERARLYTKDRILTEILNKIDIDVNTKNEEIKSKIDIDKLKNFIKDTQILTEFYNDEDNILELNDFINKIEKCYNTLLKKIKSKY